nr:WD repeat, SAM and U-box domain-containing protein 1-like [Onthophagus taurus]XP_022921311.1 WD repeat, SAM and U-box domain-containing protein 1-like [Onthophagus taurus]
MSSSCDNVKILQRFQAHTSDITSCDFAPNFTLVTGSSDKTVKIWEWLPGSGYKEKIFSPLRGHKYGVTCVKVSPQGSMLATASIDGSAVLWNLHSGTKIYTMVQMNGDPIRVCRFAPDSSILATAGDNGAICFWDLIHRSLIRTVFQHEGTTQGLAFTSDSQWLISGCSLEILNVWSMQDIGDTTKDDVCNPVASQDNAHDLGILCIDVSPHIEHEESNPFIKHYTLASSGNSDRINTWRITTCSSAKFKSDTNVSVTIEKLNELIGHSSAVTFVKYNHTGALLASSSLDKVIKIWNSAGTCLRALQGHTRYINCVCFSRDSRLIASGSNDKNINVWDTEGQFNINSELVKSYTHLIPFIQNGVQESQVIRNDEEIRESSVMLLEKFSDLAEAAINSCCFYGNDLLAIGSSDKIIRIFKVTTGDGFLEEVEYSPMEGHSYSVNYVEFSQDGTQLASASLDGSASIWNSQTGEILNTIPDNTLGVRISRFSPDGSRLLTAGDDEKATIWNCGNMEKVGELEGHLDAVTAACYSPDGKIIATASSNGDFRLWNGTVNIYVQDDAHDLGIQSCDFSPNYEPLSNGFSNDAKNYLLGTCGNDSLVKLWSISMKLNVNVAYLKELKVKCWKTLQGHGGSVIYVRFATTGEILCSTATDRQARIWAVYSGECLHVLDHDSIVTTCSFNENCSMLAVGCLDKTLWLWKLPQQLVFQTAVANKIKIRTKSVVDWTTSDILKWLEDLGLQDLKDYIANTTLDGQKLLTVPEEDVCVALDLKGDQAARLIREIKWLKQMDLEDPSIWNKSNVPIEFLCPITHEVMREPVKISDGFTYEKRAITEWFMAGKFTSPMTNAVLTNTDYSLNIELRNSIYSYLCDSHENEE